jgi:hypothetical protein
LLLQVLDAKIEDLSDRLRLGMATMQVGGNEFSHKNFRFYFSQIFFYGKSIFVRQLLESTGAAGRGKVFQWR